VIGRLKYSLVLLAVIAGYTWLLVRVTPHWFANVVTAAVLAVSIARALRTGEWGLRASALLPALRDAALFTAAAAAAMYVGGSVLGTVHGRENAGRYFAVLVPWAAGQQLALQTVLLREAQAATSRGKGIVLATAVFAVLHLPNPFLTIVTLVAAAAWCWIYDRHPNLLPLALSHALLTLVIVCCFDPAVTGRLRVGHAYLQLR
jgi:membrane protease YdiL (CAAX protease family)